MAIDTTPSTVATSALQAIPFSSLIGAPLDACIQAQAQAAKTSYEFINEVGLTIDPDTGEKKAINVTFQYNNNGNLTTLVVPLLTIVPIPYLAIDAVSIDFTANISAASSSVEETSTDTELGVDATAEASLGVGPFSLKIKANANYSSKQHSKAAQDSRYSVEYTMNVHVEGGQADMPAGLQTILNILQGSISSVGPDDMVTISPAAMDIDQSQNGTMQVTIKNNNGLLAPGSNVSLLVEDNSGESPFSEITVVQGVETQLAISAVLEAQNGSFTHQKNAALNRRVLKPFERRYLSGRKQKVMLARHQNALLNPQAAYLLNNAQAADGDSASGVTNQQGTVIFQFTLKDSVFQGTQEYQGKVIVTADVPIAGSDASRTEQEVFNVPYAIVPFGPIENFTLTSTGNFVIAQAGGEGTVTVDVTDIVEGTLEGDYVVNVKVSPMSGAVAVDSVFDAIAVSSAVGTPSAANASGKTGTTGTDEGQVVFTFKTQSGATSADNGKYLIEITAADGSARAVQAVCTVEIPTPVAGNSKAVSRTRSRTASKPKTDEQEDNSK